VTNDNKLADYRCDVQAVYDTTRKLDTTLTLDEAAKLLPDRPEWLTARRRKKAVRR
jgi:hypothetical protein